MKVTIDCDILKNKKTGVENYTYNLIKYLKQENISLTLLHDKRIKSNLFNNQEQQITNRIKYPLSRFINSIINPIKIKSNILHCPTPTLPFFKKPENLKLIITVHDLTPLIYSKHHNLKRQIYYKYLFPGIIKQADKIIADSNSTKNDIIKYLKISKNKIKVIYLGTDIKYTTQKIPAKYNIPENYILYVGTIEPRKNLIKLIDAYNLINPKEKLVIVGASGWKNKEIYKKQNKNIIFTGYIPEHDLSKFYSNAKIFVYPSLYEGFGLPILEAMACKVPVIATKISSIPEVGGNAILYVNSNKTNDLADKLKQLLGNKKLQQKLSIAGYNRSKEFSWKKTAENTLQVYNEVSNKNENNSHW